MLLTSFSQPPSYAPQVVDAPRIRFSGAEPAHEVPESSLSRLNGVMVYCSYRGKPGDPLYSLAVQVGEAIGQTQKHGQRLFVVTGGGDGLMGGVAEGAINAGSYAVGVGIPFEGYELPKHQYSEYTEHINFPLRIYGKGGFEHRSAYTVALPGGIGTLHELITKAVELYYDQTIGSSPKRIVLLDHNGFFTAPRGLLDHVQYLIDEGLTDPEFKQIFKVVKTPEEIIPALLDPSVEWTKPKSSIIGVKAVRLNCFA